MAARGLDAIGWFIATLHQALCHDKAAVILGVPPGDRDDCVLCTYERHPGDTTRRAVIRALSPAVRDDGAGGAQS